MTLFKFVIFLSILSMNHIVFSREVDTDADEQEDFAKLALDYQKEYEETGLVKLNIDEDKKQKVGKRFGLWRLTVFVYWLVVSLSWFWLALVALILGLYLSCWLIQTFQWCPCNPLGTRNDLRGQFESMTTGVFTHPDGREERYTPLDEEYSLFNSLSYDIELMII